MIVAFTRLHYGKDYLGWVISSALPFVDKFIVLYTPVPTFGRATPLPCPDSREELLGIAQTVAGDKLDWREGLSISAEVAMKLYPDTELALELDADEVIHPALFEQIRDRHAKGELTAYCYRLPFWHHWRSFRYVCDDGGWPARLYSPQKPRADAVYFDGAAARVHHFGYARAEADMRYKWSTSAHGDEFRADWWQDIWCKFPERLTDLHPVSRDYWHAQLLEADKLPPILRDHPYIDREVIA